MTRVGCSVAACNRLVKSKGWCLAHYMRWYQTGDIRADVPLRLHNVDPALRFWPKVSKGEQCWVYNGTKDRNGYGLFRLGQTHVGAHRFSYELEYGAIAEGLELDHLCRNRGCVRPSHLEAVTHLENMRRAYAHKRTT